MCIYIQYIFTSLPRTRTQTELKALRLAKGFHQPLSQSQRVDSLISEQCISGIETGPVAIPTPPLHLFQNRSRSRSPGNRSLRFGLSNCGDTLIMAFARHSQENGEKNRKKQPPLHPCNQSANRQGDAERMRDRQENKALSPDELNQISVC